MAEKNPVDDLDVTKPTGNLSQVLTDIPKAVPKKRRTRPRYRSGQSGKKIDPEPHQYRRVEQPESLPQTLTSRKGNTKDVLSNPSSSFDRKVKPYSAFQVPKDYSQSRLPHSSTEVYTVGHPNPVPLGAIGGADSTQIGGRSSKKPKAKCDDEQIRQSANGHSKHDKHCLNASTASKKLNETERVQQVHKHHWKRSKLPAASNEHALVDERRHFEKTKAERKTQASRKNSKEHEPKTTGSLEVKGTERVESESSKSKATGASKSKPGTNPRRSYPMKVNSPDPKSSRTVTKKAISEGIPLLNLEMSSCHLNESSPTGPCELPFGTNSRAIREYEVAKECFFEDISIKQLACKNDCEDEILKLKEKKNPTTKKTKTQIAAFSVITKLLDQQKETSEQLDLSIEEATLRRDVFLKCCVEIQVQLEELSSVEWSETSIKDVDSLRNKFGREVKRYDKALPIYAHRLAIMEMIECHQVCIVIGETGSGKSTQLVQYLSEAGYAANGLIVCTQPRKLAAISLAEHVSTEVNEEVGGTYGYVAARSKTGADTQVLYMTDHTLLNECIADPTLSKYSCLVIDEAHERSIHTDILIAFIKRCLPNRQDLKVVITSATINPTLFSTYFGGRRICPIIEVPGRTYPVQVTWDDPQGSILDRDYVSEAVNKVHRIHLDKRDEPGDVLIFLTSPAEIERACKLAKDVLKTEAVVLPLHGKLQPEDQKKIFLDTEMGKRKVVFSTNVAETSITIPGIVHVIDTGLSKEMCYDAEKNMNSLEIRPISKSSADQRKGRAGRTCPGECYRLYSEGDYTDMRDDSVPEILRITLAFAVIKLYEFGIKDIHSFEFVESPDRKALDEAIENLKFLGAIKDGKLTKLGRKMALLPLDPNLSKILFDAISRGVGVEAAAAVAISTLAGRVFFRPVNTELRDESDRKRLPFCQESGDQMTHLHAYFEWSHQERKKQTKWCVENYVNAKSMRMVQQIIEELLLTLKQACNIRMQNQITSLTKADKILPKLFFDAFLRNMCVHLGHNQVGYWSERLPDEQLVIYYGSSLHYLSSVPQCVVYEKTQKTSQHFLLQALPVREEWIQEAIKSGKLPCHPTENGLFQFYQVSPLSCTNLGPALVFKLQKKYPPYRDTIVSEFRHFQVQPVFEYLKDQGTLRVFAQQSYHGLLRESITGFTKSFKEELKEESYKCGVTSNNDDVKMVIGMGGCIQQILMPDDFQTVVVRGLSRGFIPDAEHELKSYGKCTSNTTYNQRGAQLFIQYSRPADAVKALQHEFVSFDEPGVKILRFREHNRNLFSLKVDWWRRQRRDHAYVNFSVDNQDELHSHLTRCFSQHTIIYDSSGLSFNPMWDRCSIRICRIGEHMTENEIRQRLLANIPFCDEVEFSIYFLYSDAFDETDESYMKHRDHLDAVLAQCTKKSDFYVVFSRPQRKHVLYRASIYFEDSVLCWKMFKHLRGELNEEEEEEDDEEEDDEDEDEEDDDDGSDNEATSEDDDDMRDMYEYEPFVINELEEYSSDSDGEPHAPTYLVELSLSSSTRYTKQVFSAIKSSVKHIHHHYSSISDSVAIKYDKQDRWGNTFVSISASDLGAFTEANEMLAEAVKPEIISFPDCKTSQYISTLNFQKTAKEIQAQTSTYIKISASSLSASCVNIYGTKEQRVRASEEVRLHLEMMMQDGVRCFEVNLKEHGPGLMKYLIAEYGADIAQLPQAFKGVTATRLNPRRQILTLFAKEAGCEAFLRSLDNFKPEYIIVQAPALNTPEASSVSECCICFEAHNSKNSKRKTFFYRLEYCGHVYCRECIQQQLEANSIEFPVTCAADKCDEQLVWRDFENLFKDKVKELRDITSASFKSYIARNTDKVHNCITPDCNMIYVVSGEGKRFVCRQCGINICTRCHTTWHEGFDTCEAYKNRSSGDAELKKWMSSDKTNRKKCPQCSSPIEKVSGCQNVSCTQCKHFICWECLASFKKCGDCYAHLSEKHGGAYGRAGMARAMDFQFI